jgi:hypothetical protein
MGARLPLAGAFAKRVGGQHNTDDCPEFEDRRRLAGGFRNVTVVELDHSMAASGIRFIWSDEDL